MTHFLEENKEALKGKTIIPFCTYQATYRAETLVLFEPGFHCVSDFDKLFFRDDVRNQSVVEK